MKKIVLIVAIICIAPIMYGQQNFGFNEKLFIDNNRSVIHWEGSDLFNMNTHSGTVKFKFGTLRRSSNAITGNVIIGGEFEIDMNSIINTDGKYNEMLVEHLKNEDFFDIKKYPIATLEIINVHYINAKSFDVIAHLTIKGNRQIINYRSTMEIINNQMVMKSKFAIDRTLWGINYKSKNFFAGMKDEIISDTINFDVLIVASLDGC
ncbi:YceI family protein [Aquimarina sp. MMG016]|uniref:YceI family protein n=1 Tax=Aquimarina sp. MMG016 TaxID=2822690 RepID=UPI001B3A1E5C|nr:YceI family protein [Aquimarina sp. MMG016]MBQ4822893.1 YceI family protein [Aquimarina sp. MMG016]